MSLNINKILLEREMGMYGIISTWRMAYSGIVNAYEQLNNGACAGDILEQSINEVEAFENFISVGLGGLPNEEGTVQLDAAYMDGSTFEVGAVAGLEDIVQAVSVARALSKDRYNVFRVGEGVKKYALSNGFKEKSLLTEYNQDLWRKRLSQVETNQLSPYDGHDTIGTVVVDNNKNVVAGTSSSGLFMKKQGRVGDSPLPGSGLYADSDIGGAAATGLGEDLMKGILSYETVRKMGNGLSPMDAAQTTLNDFEKKLARKCGKVGAMSLVAMNNNGEWGIATNVDFTFVVATKQSAPAIYLSYRNKDGFTIIEKAEKKWMEDYILNVKLRQE